MAPHPDTLSADGEGARTAPRPDALAGAVVAGTGLGIPAIPRVQLEDTVAATLGDAGHPSSPKFPAVFPEVRFRQRRPNPGLVNWPLSMGEGRYLKRGKAWLHAGRPSLVRDGCAARVARGRQWRARTPQPGISGLRVGSRDHILCDTVGAGDAQPTGKCPSLCPRGPMAANTAQPWTIAAPARKAARFSSYACSGRFRRPLFACLAHSRQKTWGDRA